MALSVIIFSAFGILGCCAFLVAVSPFNKVKTVFGVFGGLIILAGIVYVAKEAEFAFANSVVNSRYQAFGNVRNSLPWWTFPMLTEWQMILVYAGIGAAGIMSGYSLFRAIRAGMKGGK